jgi:hypothetical protein
MDWQSNLDGLNKMFGEGDKQQQQVEEQVEKQQEREAVPQAQPPAPGQRAAPAVAAATSASTGDKSGPPAETATGLKKTDLSVRVKAFLDKAHEKNVTEIRASMEEDAMLYDAISAANKRSSAAANLLGGPTAQVEGLKSLLDLGDGRILSGGLRLAITAKKIICTSFDNSCGDASGAASTARKRPSRLGGWPTAPAQDKWWCWRTNRFLPACQLTASENVSRFSLSKTAASATW